MHPVLQVSKLTEFGHLEVLSKVDLVGVVLQRIVKSTRSQLTVVSYPDYLGL